MENINNTQLFKISTVIILTSNFLSAGSCANGVCGVVRPHIPSDIENNMQLKPFNFCNKKEIKEGYDGWVLIDNGGDKNIGENRLMSGVDVNSFLADNDKVSLFGLISSKKLYSGKVSYAYPISWKNLVAETSYIYTNYTLTEPTPGSTGIGTMSTIQGKITYPVPTMTEKKLKLSFSLNKNNINEEINNGFFIADNRKNSYSGTVSMNFQIHNYPLFHLNTNHKFHIAITSGHLSFDNINDEILDKSTVNTVGSYTKLKIDYSNVIPVSKNMSIETHFKSQYAFKSKNLDDSESFTVGGMNRVKVYAAGSAYGSNGMFLNIEAKYKLPTFNNIKNSIGTFYDYGKVWDSENANLSLDTISVQDTGIGIYTSYKKFFSKAQIAFKLGDSTILTQNENNYRIILQAGLVF